MKTQSAKSTLLNFFTKTMVHIHVHLHHQMALADTCYSFAFTLASSFSTYIHAHVVYIACIETDMIKELLNEVKLEYTHVC